MTAQVEDLGTRSHRVLNKLAKWRLVFAGWQLGTRSRQDGEARAVKDHREVTSFLRAEVSALTGLLIRKGVFTAEEFTEELAAEAVRLDADYEQKFPGFRPKATQRFVLSHFTVPRLERLFQGVPREEVRL